MSEHATRDEVSVEELRRRLYSPGATGEDHARYRAAIEAAQAARIEPPPADEPVPETPSDAPSPRLSRRPRGLMVAVGSGAVVIATLAVLALHPPAPSPPTPAVQAPVRAETLDPADAPPPPSPVDIDEGTRAGFLRNLEAGRTAGIGPYLAAHLAGSLGTAVPRVLEWRGRGPETLTLVRPAAALAQGRATVFLVTELAGWAGWTAYRAGTAYEGRDYLQTEAGRAGNQEGGALTAGSFDSASGDRPLRLDVDVPAGVPWGLAIAFSG
ncbi:hypothetical protein [Amnibacterium sp.]|uniref:hypothetical protein n=1 Tax=Amnibacterium sp. TaxID=1872496 RepID=UPI0026166CC9|nr:hypothetical protein [Amnibacterium sp.]MCU1472746.1 hypothetical protein [Amnibacterium sp.]